MNIIKRTCATCVAFNSSATGEEVVCGNLTFFTVDRGTPHAVNREPNATDCCDIHQTHAEDAAEDAAEDIAMAGFWQGMPSALSAAGLDK